jgi:hypothetical protein
MCVYIYIYLMFLFALEMFAVSETSLWIITVGQQESKAAAVSKPPAILVLKAGM